jgi:hypothetical protein
VTEAAIGPAPVPGVPAPLAAAPAPVERCADRFRASAWAFLPAGIVASVFTVFYEGPSVFAATYLTTVCAAVIMFPVARWTTMSLLSDAPVQPEEELVVRVPWTRTTIAAVTEMVVVSVVGLGLGILLDRSVGAPVWVAFFAPVLLGFAFLALWQAFWAELVEARRGGILVRPAGITARRANAQYIPHAVTPGP